MAREKQFVFKSWTTAEGLKALDEVKSCFKIGWDEFVIEAVSAHYNLNRAMMTLPKKDKPADGAAMTEWQTNRPKLERQTENMSNKKQTKTNKK